MPGTRWTAVALLSGALTLGGCGADNEYGEDESAIGAEDDTPNAVAEPGFAESPVEDPGIGEGGEEFGGATGGTLGEDVEVPITDAADTVGVRPRR